MAKKKSNFWTGIKNLALIIICFGVLSVFYKGFLNVEDVYKLRYPTEYEDIVLKYSDMYGVDQYLVYSIIRSESNYTENAVSNKGAIGLMQIMPDTGSWVAEKLKIENFTSEDLFDTEKNIMIGVWYFKYLLDKFDGEISLAVAAYNAGPTNVNKWLSQKEYSENGDKLNVIPFEETRKYEEKVMNTYAMYKRIYQGV